VVESVGKPYSGLLVGRRCDHRPMTAWRDVEEFEPEFAQRVRSLFDARRHKTIATLRADGSPRISGIEVDFEGGELVFGSMLSARKSADLRRDPRFALHSATVDPVTGSEARWPGEAKISGHAIAAGPIAKGPAGDRFHADIAEVVHTHLNDQATMLVVQWWTPTRAATGRAPMTFNRMPPGRRRRRWRCDLLGEPQADRGQCTRVG
jgi:hypothetical protein